MKYILFCCLGFFGLAHAATTLKVLTFNVYAKPDPFNSSYTRERMHTLCERLKTREWDVVMLQEVWTRGNRQRLASCGYPYVMDLRRTGSSKRERSLGSGLLILSKYPLAKKERLVLPRPWGRLADILHGEAIAWKSLYLAQAILPSGERVWLATTHLVANYCKSADFRGCDSYQVVRYNQLQRALDHLARRTGGARVIFGGDFNSGPHPARDDLSWKHLTSKFLGLRQAAYDPARTCTSCSTNSFKGRDSGKIDHIFVSGDLEPHSGRVLLNERFKSKKQRWINVSDHYAWETSVSL